MKEELPIVPILQVMGKNSKGFLDGDWILSEDMSDDGEIGIVQLKHVGNGMFLKKDFKFITRRKFNELKCTPLTEGDLLVSRMADPIGRSCILPKLDFPTVTVVDVTIIRPNPNIADTEYLNYILNTKSFQNQAKKFSVGTTRARISRKNLEKLTIPLPSITTQKKISSIMNKVTCLKENRAEADKLTDDYLTSMFLKMFGDPVTNPMKWKKARTIDVASCIVPGRDKPRSFSGDIPWITTEDLHHLGKTLNSGKELGLSLSEIRKVKAKIIPKDSVLMTCVGDLGVVSIAGRDMVINQQLHSFQCSEIMNNVFLMFNLSFFKPYMSKIATSTTVPYMNKVNCNSIPTILPPIEKQKKFAEIYEQIESVKVFQEKSKQHIDDLFGMLMQEAVRDELVC